MHDTPNNSEYGGSAQEGHGHPRESTGHAPAGHSEHPANEHGAPAHEGESQGQSGLEHEHGHEHHPGREHEGGHSGHPHHPVEVVIQIDRTPYKEVARDLTGAEIRRIPTRHIPQDRDLFEVVPGAPDRKILDNTVVRLRDGQRFFTAPGQINPGCSKSNG